MVIFVGVACFTLTAIGVALFTSWAVRSELLDLPNHRSSHSVPTPRGAGVVIVVVTAAVVLLGEWTNATSIGGAGIAALVIAGVSGVDDLRPLPSLLRLTVHATCAMVAALLIPADAGIVWSVPVTALAVLWIVGLTNAYNFMDGIDGLSGVQAVVAGTAVILASSLAGYAGGGIIGVTLAAANGGFLLHNWPPARVFMGDVGSAFLGFSFAVLTLEVGVIAPSAAVVIGLSLWPFVFDTGLTFLRRLLRGENVLASHRSHLYQRLVIAGRRHRSVSLAYSALAAAGVASAYVWVAGLLPWPVLLLVPALAGALVAAVSAAESRVGAWAE